MLRYFVKRILWIIPIVLGVMLIVMILLELTPGEPARQILGNFATDEDVAELTTELGLDRPLLVRYFDYWIGVFHGDIGTSYFTKGAVWTEMITKFPYTFLLVSVRRVLEIEI